MNLKFYKLLLAAVGINLLFMDSAIASGLDQISNAIGAGAAPWEGPLDDIRRTLTGSTAKAVSAIAFATSSMMLIMGVGGESAIRIVARIGMGMSLCFGGYAFLAPKFGIAAGAIL